jgi:DNA-binding MarR family transcriptional regulator
VNLPLRDWEVPGAVVKIESVLDDFLTLRVVEETLRPADLTVTQVCALLVLEQGGASCRMTEMSRRLGATPAVLTGVVDRLEKKGLVVRSKRGAGSDRRVLDLRLTEAGRGVLDGVREIQLGWDQ